MINDPYELLTHLYLIRHRRTRLKGEEIEEILNSEECLKRLHDKGNFLLLLSSVLLKYFMRFNQKVEDFKEEIYNQKLEKPRKEKRDGGKERRTKKYTRKQPMPTLQELVEQELENPSNVESSLEARRNTKEEDSKNS